MIERADGIDGPAAARLYELLLADAIRRLPAGIDRLVIVADGPLHQLPFDALRDGPDGPRLAARYELVVVPSATLWRHWREDRAGATTQRTLAFADPVLESGASRSSASASERSAVMERGLRLARLPYARLETRAIAEHVGGAEMLVGPLASEKALKERDLRKYDILHFAAHAVADEGRPERSAVLLAAGAPTEDGLLQTREIEELDLAGRVVVLSACETAAGAILSGEGVLSLARAFFAAGAKTVIGTRWPVRDRDAAALFDSFYRRLGEGASLSEALKDVKIEAIEAGQPSARWASLVLLGDGDFRPFPGGRRPQPAPPTRSPLTFVLLALGAGVILWRFSRTAPHPIN
jgi:CHAT domain-containing protein